MKIIIVLVLALQCLYLDWSFSTSFHMNKVQAFMYPSSFSSSSSFQPFSYSSPSSSSSSSHSFSVSHSTSKTRRILLSRNIEVQKNQATSSCKLFSTTMGRDLESKTESKNQMDLDREESKDVEIDAELDINKEHIVYKQRMKTKKKQDENNNTTGKGKDQSVTITTATTSVLKDLQQVDNVVITNLDSTLPLTIDLKNNNNDNNDNNVVNVDNQRLNNNKDEQQEHRTDMGQRKEKEKKKAREHPLWAGEALPWNRSVASSGVTLITETAETVLEEKKEEENKQTKENDIPLLYMPFLKHQIEHLNFLELHIEKKKEKELEVEKLNFNKIKSIVKEHDLPAHYINKLSDKKAARVGSKCYQVKDMFRKIRMTYVDAGETLQVLNSVWYPEYKYDLPILGIDLLYFGASKIITVIDFQPLSQKKEYTSKYIDPLKPIKEKYPLLQGTISNRYYEDTRWFSEGMLFSRMEKEEDIMKVLYPAYQEYMSVYTKMMEEAQQLESQLDPLMSQEEKQMKENWIKSKHVEYDEYNMIRDPAGKMFQTYFGKEWADDYMANFLFEDCPEGVNPHS